MHELKYVTEGTWANSSNVTLFAKHGIAKLPSGALVMFSVPHSGIQKQE